MVDVPQRPHHLAVGPAAVGAAAVVPPLLLMTAAVLPVMMNDKVMMQHMQELTTSTPLQYFVSSKQSIQPGWYAVVHIRS